MRVYTPDEVFASPGCLAMFYGETEVGKTVNFEVLLISDEEGKDVKVGSPVLSAKASGLIESHGAAKKVDVVKYKAKSKYRRRVGHRQPQTKVKITKLA